jgi:hypothetical protein
METTDNQHNVRESGQDLTYVSPVVVAVGRRRIGDVREIRDFWVVKHLKLAPSLPSLDPKLTFPAFPTCLQYQRPPAWLAGRIIE